MITIKSQELKQFQYLKELLEEDISDDTTNETNCYALWANSTLEVDPVKDSTDGKKSKKDKKNKTKKEPSINLENQDGDSSISILEADIQPKNVSSPYPLLRLTEGIFAGYSRKDPSYSLYYAFESDIYFNTNKESNIESLLRSDWSPTEQEWNTANIALQLINKYGITKYSEYPPFLENDIHNSDYQNILLVDQPIDDESVLLGNENEQTFNDMFFYAFDNYPYANIYVKLHPDTIDGKKEGYLQKLLNKHGLQDHPSIHIVDYHCNITFFFHFVQEVFTVTSQVGFEALLRNKSVRCFGTPFYSGWGLTTDMQEFAYPKPQRSIMDIFIALVLKNTLYLNPFTNKKGTILDLLEYISLQQRHSNRKNIVFYNTKFVNKPNIDILLNTDTKNSVNKSKKLNKFIDDFILTDNRTTFKEVESFKYRAFIDESFLFGNSNSQIDVMSLIVDHNGPYYDPNAQSDLDYMLNNETYTQYEKDCASKFIDSLKLKYLMDAKEQNPGNVLIKKQESPSKKVIFVPGQNEKDDFTFSGGELFITSDYDLLVAICQKVDNTLIVYKPDPSSNIKKITDLGKDGLVSVNTLIQERNNRIIIEHDADIGQCIDICDEVHLLNHNCGIEAIVKGKKVVTYGLPFFGGLGLTEDVQQYPRPKRKVTLEEFVLATIMLYPRYKIPGRKGFFSAAEALEYDKVKHNQISKHSSFFELFSKLKLLF